MFRSANAQTPSLADRSAPRCAGLADTLERFELPFFGRLASSFVDEE